jgi:hypothetical protein
MAFVGLANFAASQQVANPYPIVTEPVEPIYLDQSLEHWPGPYDQSIALPPDQAPVLEPYVFEDEYAGMTAPSVLPPGTRPGAFQKANFMASWMPNFGGRDGFGISQMGANLLFGFPLPDRESPLLVTPDYTVNFLDGPTWRPVPARLHEASVDFHHFRAINDRWTVDAAVTIGSYADEENFATSDSFRTSGRVLGMYQADPQTKWIFGALYVNRANARLLPALGYIHATEDVSIELVFPRPRYAWRTWSNGPPGYDERWCYIQGEFGGGVWSIDRPSGARDTLSYSDMRFIVGTERKIVGGLSHRWEVGYVFGRELEFDGFGGTVDIDPSMFIRTGWTY